MIRLLLSKLAGTSSPTEAGDDFDLERAVNSSHYGARPAAQAAESSRDEDLLSWARSESSGGDG